MLQNHVSATIDFAKWYISLDSVSVKKYKLNENLETIIKYLEKTYHKNNSSEVDVLAKLYMKNQQFQQIIELYEKTSYLIDSALQCILIYHKGLYKQKKDIIKVKKYIKLANSIDKDQTKAFLIKNSITC